MDPQSRHRQKELERPFSNPTKHVTSQPPLAIHHHLGSLARSPSNLYVPPTQLWPAATSCIFFSSLLFFSKFQDLIAKNTTSSVTTSPRSSPHSQQSNPCWICLSLGAQGHGCLEGKATQAAGALASLGHTCSRRSGTGSAEWLLPSSGSRPIEKELGGHWAWLHGAVASGWSTESPSSSRRSALVFGVGGNTAW